MPKAAYSRRHRQQQEDIREDDSDKKSSLTTSMSHYRHHPYRNDGNKRKQSTNSIKEYSKKPTKAIETNEELISQRRKQIQYGKNTRGYDEYIKKVPKKHRPLGHPTTPDMEEKCSRRAWLGRLKVWRKALHSYDPDDDGEEEDLLANLDSDILQETSEHINETGDISSGVPCDENAKTSTVVVNDFDLLDVDLL